VKKIITLLIVTFFVAGILHAEPFKGEASLITASGLTDRYDPKDAKTYKKVFGEQVKTVKYWIHFFKDTAGMGTVQSVEWFSPEGKLWFKENDDFCDVVSPFRPKVLERIYSMDMKNLPHGVWAVRFIWNNNIIEQRYFSYGTNKEPSESEIANLNDQIKRYDKLIALTDKTHDLKLSSYLLSDFTHYFGQQRIYQPTSCIGEEKTTYLLNVYGGDMVITPAVFLYIFSPDGKLYIKDRLSISRASGSVNYYARFKKNIQLDAKDAPPGVWKLVVYYANDDRIVDEKYFYFGDSKNTLLTKETINNLENKIDEKLIVDSLPDYLKKEVMKYRQSSERRIKVRIKNGMSKEDILKLLGKPNKIEANKYDDAEIWLYDNVAESAANAMKNSGMNYQILHGTGDIGHDLIGGAIYTIISAGVGGILADRLEIVIKDSKVVASKGAI